MARKNNQSGKNGNSKAEAAREVVLPAEGRWMNIPEAEHSMLRKEAASIIVENIAPAVDQGLFPVKCVVGETFYVEADIFKDGHDVLKAAIKYRSAESTSWDLSPMVKGDNDRWRGFFIPDENRQYVYSVEAWVDPIATWVQFMLRKCPANPNVQSDLAEGIQHLEILRAKASGADKKNLELIGRMFKLSEGASDEVLRILRSEKFVSLASKYEIRKNVSEYHKPLQLTVDRKQAEYSAWYELFPRSQAKRKGRHGTFRDCLKRLPDIKRMGFDVIYLPPIHPIGTTHRKGANNTLTVTPDSPGSPWAIGAKEGGHKAIHPELGTMAEFTDFVEAANEYDIEIALDLAYQCSPDHPYVKSHPEWFYRLPDGTIRYAENPPKKYQDIYPIDFNCGDAESLWEELKSVVLFWVDKGVKIFRVDNPHTKPFKFWQWLIQEVQEEHPDVLFLAEAFTRPKVMKHLAKAGFSQSYTYFTWRNAKWELRQYLEELTQTEMRHYFRGNFFVNTPDILHEYLQRGGRPAFKIRLALAATLSSVYGIYSGFELCENTPLHGGSEEYLDSEKYEIKFRDWDREGNIKDFIARVNRIRRENAALHSYKNLEFYGSCNDNILCYGKRTEDNGNIIIVVVNLDPFHVHEDLVTLPLWKFGIEDWQTFQVKDLITGDKYYWKGPANYIRLDPQAEPVHILRVRI
ncbi:MAG: alpha-1,4-glucan--maltose-1-phosphate maltosyltransferase [Candidatus Omnitrophota bacterium]|nr:alpha-1,4-glucan--maltose-1-phosphate maltosyltransferase [Candidatus Omnitrophota bacterium]